MSPTNSPFFSSSATFPSIHAPAGFSHSTEQITDDGGRRLRRFNFSLFIVATQTTFKLLRFRPVPLPSRPNLRLARPKIFAAQQSPDDLPSLKSGWSSNLGLMGCVELKTRQLQWKNWNLVFVWDWCAEGGKGIRLKLDWRLNGEWTEGSLKDATCY